MGAVLQFEPYRQKSEVESWRQAAYAAVDQMIEKLKNTPGINGMHMMAVHWEEIVPRLVEESGVPRPVIRSLEEVADSAPAGGQPASVAQAA